MHAGGLVIGAVERAMQRSAALVHEEMRRRLFGLATVASVAPLLGVFATLLGIVTSFRAPGGEKSTALAIVNALLGHACLSTALGLLVGLQAFWCYRYFISRLGDVDLEMESATLLLVNDLRRRIHFPLPPLVEPRGEQFLFLGKYEQEGIEEQDRRRQSLPLALALLGLGWCLKAARYFFNDSLPVGESLRAASIYLPLVFCVSWIGTTLLRMLLRKRQQWLVWGSGVCLLWCLAELVFGFHYAY